MTTIDTAPTSPPPQTASTITETPPTKKSSQWAKLQVVTQLVKLGNNNKNNNVDKTKQQNEQTTKGPAPLTIDTQMNGNTNATNNQQDSSKHTRITSNASANTTFSGRIKINPFTLFKKSSATPTTPLLPEEDVNANRLKVFVGTWNMYGRLLPIDLATFLTKSGKSHRLTDDDLEKIPHLLDDTPTHPYHILAIGTQECEHNISESLIFPSKELWEKRLQEYLGPQYTMLQTETLAALHLAVFVWEPVSHLVRGIQCDRIKTGWGNLVGNKGAVAISILFGSRSLLFINCHLRAHQNKLAERNANVHRILHELKIQDFSNGPSLCGKHHHHASSSLSRIQSTASSLGANSIRRRRRRNREKNKANPEKADVEAIFSDEKKEHHEHPSVMERFDHVFLFGDTNYRVNADRKLVLDTIKKGDFRSLLRFDQLTVERNAGTSPLKSFKEHPINFPPTYKLDIQTEDDSESSSGDSSSEEDDHSSPFDWFSSASSSRRSTAQTTPVTTTGASSSATTPSASSAQQQQLPMQPPPLPQPKNKAAITTTNNTDTNIATTADTNQASTSESTDNKKEEQQQQPQSKLQNRTRHRKQRSQSAPEMRPLSQHLVSPCDLIYDSSPKQRVPSWTDRILWHDRRRDNQRPDAPPPVPALPASVIAANKTTQSRGQPAQARNNNNKQAWWKRKRNIPKTRSLAAKKKEVNKDTICWWYGAILDQKLVGVSDHMPVVGVFGIWFDEWKPKEKNSTPMIAAAPAVTNGKTATEQDTQPSTEKHTIEKEKRKNWWSKLIRSI